MENKTIKGTSVSVIYSWIEAIDKIIPEGTLGNEGEEKDVTFSREEIFKFRLLRELFPHNLGDRLEDNGKIRCVHLRLIKEDLSLIKKIIEPFL